MKNQIFRILILSILCVLVLSTVAAAQQPAMIKRTAQKTDSFDFGPGGTLAVIGAPKGSITVEGNKGNTIEVTANIEILAPSEADLNRLSEVIGFVTEESLGRIGIISVGTHDKKYLKKRDKKFPKTLVGLPFRIDYVIKVPQYCDLQIDGGVGDLSISGVEGQMRVNYLDSAAKITLLGGGITTTIGTGTLDILIPTRSWRGRFADMQLANGTMNVYLPPHLNAEVDAVILRTGKIENVFDELKPRARKIAFTDTAIAAKAGNGGIPLKFTVGDGTLRILPAGKPE